MAAFEGPSMVSPSPSTSRLRRQNLPVFGWFPGRRIAVVRANGAGSNQPPSVAAGDAPEASVLATQWGQVGKPRVLLRTRGRTRGRFGERT